MLDPGSNDVIAWPSRGGGVTSQAQLANDTQFYNNSSGDKQDQKNNIAAQNRSIPQFQSEEDNSAFLDGKAILGALNGNPSPNHVENNMPSTQLSPIA